MHLGIDVVQTSRHDTGKGFGKLLLLIKSLRTTDGAVETLFILQPIHVFSAVRIQVLKTAGKLVVQSVDKADDAAADADNTTFFTLRSTLCEIIVIISDLLNCVSVTGNEDADETVNLALRR